MKAADVVVTDDLERSVDQYLLDGYRIEMILPADSPREVLLSKNSQDKLLLRTNARTTPGGSEWSTGRAGMMYRDLIPDRMGGRLIASHIRLTQGGEVPDYVHYHKVRFQMIYCLGGAIKVVYEDQGGAFWLRAGDCVLQPPEIRHRVLWAEEGSEVLELGMPAMHETWVEHEMTLPTQELRPDRQFSGQTFVRHIAAEHADERDRDTGIAAATEGLAAVRVMRLHSTEVSTDDWLGAREFAFLFVLSGEVVKRSSDGAVESMPPLTASLVTPGDGCDLRAASSAELLIASF